MRILITNSVPLNGGDHALLLSTILYIKTKYPQALVNVLCSKYEICKKHITDDINLYPDWEYTILNGSETKKNKIRKKLLSYGIKYYSNISILFSSSKEKEIIKLYKNADIILSSAGGYIHDIYGYEYRLIAYEMALKFNKKLFFIGHSMGPFYPENKKFHKRLSNVLNNSEDIVLREYKSDSHLNKLYNKLTNKRVTIDIAFSLYNYYPTLFALKNTSNKKIVLSFRKWGNENTTNDIIRKATILSNHLIEQGFKLTFLSTCQGIPEYVDDSIIAEDIISGLSDIRKSFCRIDKQKYNSIELIKEYSKYDMYIGMRLHGAILSMLGGTHAFNIAYEDKTEGIFSILEMKSNQICYEKEVNEWILYVDKFIKEFTINNEKLQTTIKKASKLALTSFDKI